MLMTAINLLLLIPAPCCRAGQALPSQRGRAQLPRPELLWPHGVSLPLISQAVWPLSVHFRHQQI